jgi:large subunit ribosomal protein L1
MKKKSKRAIFLSNICNKKCVTLNDYISLLKNIGNAKFIESVEAHVNLNINPKNSKQQIRATLDLPHGTGKLIKIAVLTEQELIPELINLGVHSAGNDDLIDKISKGTIDFDLLVTTPQLMPKLAKLGRILGPKGLMPSPKSGTVTQNLYETIKEFKRGKLEYRSDKDGIIHLLFGKVSFLNSELKENLIAVYKSIEKNKPQGIKGAYFKSFSICTTMSPSINLDLSLFSK